MCAISAWPLVICSFLIDGEAIVACKLGREGIVSKRLGSTYRSGRSPHWVKVKNPKAPESVKPRRIGTDNK